MEDAGWWSLIIRGKNLNFDKIQEKLKITPTSISKEGKDYNSKILEPLKHDVWIYEIEFDENKDSKQALEELLVAIKPVKRHLLELDLSANVQIRWYVQTDYAQIYYEIPPKLLKMLSDMELKLEISILSWGGIKDT
ncbi:MAG: DUF4279 domain-containing protein [Syntrophomonadaceae bacterium]|nr:DUF4279 domain-containing protein [Syntrophomonadaceae bacterium]